MTTLPKINILIFDKLSILEQLQIEEALLRTSDENWCLVNKGSAPAIIMGISGKQELLVVKESTLPLIRRFSGGGTVVVDENTFFVSFICCHSTLQERANPDSVHRFAEGLYSEVFSTLPFALKENDYVFGDKKFGGNAQYFSKERWLHHTTFLWDWNPTLMEHLLHPPRMPSYRAERRHGDFLCRLSDHLPGQEALEERLINALEKRFTLDRKTLSHVEPHLQLPHRRTVNIV